MAIDVAGVELADDVGARRAVAGEAGVPFFSTNGAEFVEMFVGVGAASTVSDWSIGNAEPASSRSSTSDEARAVDRLGRFAQELAGDVEQRAGVFDERAPGVDILST